MSAADGGQGTNEGAGVQQVRMPFVVDLDDGRREFGLAPGPGAQRRQSANAVTRPVLMRLIFCRTTPRSGLVGGGEAPPLP
ncbi:hypothetical protein ACWD3I_28690 [Streptomyces sp. NPDC002817]|uniref:hypothetical protein n=1 Tax=Streptomyces sp. NPDC088357 TaxID=3154655 RepID=UPI0034325FD7